MSSIDTTIKAFQVAYRAVGYEHRNLNLECKEVSKFKENVLNERRAIVRKRNFLSAERIQLVNARSRFD